MDKTQKINRDYYNRNAEWWASSKTHSFFHEKQFRVFERLLKKGARVLDIGCANGIHVPLFLGIGRKLKYEGLDISKNLVAIAKARYPQLAFRLGDIVERKTLPKKKYDAFWAGATLQHVPLKDWPQMMENIEHILKKGAIGYVTVPNERPNAPDKDDMRHFTVFTDKQARAMMASRGWKVLKAGTLGPTRGTLTWHWYIVKIV